MKAFQAGESDLNGGQNRELLADASGDSPRRSLAGQSQAPKRKRRAAVRLSRVDAERLARGEIANPEEALHLNDLRETRSLQREESAVAARDANERRLLGDRPPHFGTL